MITIRSAHRRVSAWLEGPARVTVALPLDPVRELVLPARRAVVAVGGATLGGSGRTPLAIALARSLARDHRVALVGHAYGARPGHARVVRIDDALDEVGDEALIAAEALAGIATVHVAPTRSEALMHAAACADVLVVDRLLQTRPIRVARSILALDARRQWGSGSVVPFGDLVATRERLRAAADEQVVVGGRDAEVQIDLDQPHARRVGLVTACARPERVVADLAARAVRPVVHVELADHGRRDRAHLDSRLRAIAHEYAVDAWLVDAKTRVQLVPGLREVGAPIVPIHHTLAISSELVARTRAAIVRTLESGRARC